MATKLDSGGGGGGLGSGHYKKKFAASQRQVKAKVAQGNLEVADRYQNYPYFDSQ